MGWSVGRWLALLACLATPALAQGVFTPSPGSAPAATGPTSVNPSAAPSSTNPNAFNPSAAPSAVSTPNAMNPSATPSTFAPQVTGPPSRSVVPSASAGPRRVARPSRERRARARHQEQKQAPAAESRRGDDQDRGTDARAEPKGSSRSGDRGAAARAENDDAPPKKQVLRRADQRARSIMGSVCRGC
jgi:hypothetical protein